MSYAMYFWCEEWPLDQDPDSLCNLLAEERDIEGVAHLPLERIKRRFAEVFPGIDDGLTSLDWEGAGSYFQVNWPPDPVNMLIVDCGYQLLNSQETMNKIIDIAHEFGCALYDPQVGQRFEQPDSPVS